MLARYFRDPPGEADIVHSFSGVRPLYDDSAENPSAVTRDYVFDVEPKQPDGDRAPLLSVFGGKITTYRKLAEHALDKLAPFFPRLGPAWTAAAPLPGGDMPDADFERWLAGFRASRPWLPAPLARHYGRLYGTRAEALLAGAGARRPGPAFRRQALRARGPVPVARGMGRDGRGHPDPAHQARPASRSAQVAAFGEWLVTQARACQPLHA